jgi:hypothetical protein
VSIDLDQKPTSLYRFYDSTGTLLYIGITAQGQGRWYQHQSEKAWWPEVSRATVEHFPDRPSAASAEVDAITAEGPMHNVHHNNGRQAAHNCTGSAYGPYEYEAKRSGFEKVGRLWLEPEPKLITCVDEVWDEDGPYQLDYWLAALRRHEVSTDEILVRWFVNGDNCFEAAPFEDMAAVQRLGGYIHDDDDDTRHFLKFYTSPHHAVTGEPINWFSLPVHYPYPRLHQTLGYQLSPLQPTIRLNAIIRSRNGWHGWF